MDGQKPSVENRSNVDGVETSGQVDMNKGDEKDENFGFHKFVGNPGKYFWKTINKIRGKS